MPKKKTRLPNHREAVLLGCLINSEKFGRELRDEYQNRCKQPLPLGSLYTTLDRMVDKGFLKSRVGESTPGRRGNRRTYYRITAAGQSALNAYELWAVSAVGVPNNVA